jgi:hypothetical protein
MDHLFDKLTPPRPSIYAWQVLYRLSELRPPELANMAMRGMYMCMQKDSTCCNFDLSRAASKAIHPSPFPIQCSSFL